ncbi:MAG: FG-GAP repeat protein, partial [Deltaproteobacteria bacterium]|nr:FG-GAP repeat protein [Deltaproteobacteria bacterium]
MTQVKDTITMHRSAPLALVSLWFAGLVGLAVGCEDTGTGPSTATGSGGDGGATSTAAGTGGSGGSAPSCKPNEALCDSVCVDTSGDAKHCGKCDNACGATSQCKTGACEVCALNLLAKVDYTVGSEPRSVTTGDFNGDGKLDLATANTTGN